jgi:hypothetical protein
MHAAAARAKRRQAEQAAAAAKQAAVQAAAAKVRACGMQQQVAGWWVIGVSFFLDAAQALAGLIQTTRHTLKFACIAKHCNACCSTTTQHRPACMSYSMDRHK